MEMEQVKRRRMIGPCTLQRLEDVPVELIHRIQMLMPVKDAARTCMLSKSWLHAWSTIPTLRFHQPVNLLSIQQEKKYIKFINRTLRRYRRDNIPVVSFDLHFRIHDQRSVFLANKWIKKVASISCLEKLNLTLSVNNAPFTLPDEIFSGENLDTISVEPVDVNTPSSNLCFCTNPSIKCVNLRVIKLIDVKITEEAFQNLLCTCSLLEKIELSLYPEGLKTIKVKNLHYLHELKILPGEQIAKLEINDVPSLHLFSYDLTRILSKRVSFDTGIYGSVRELFLCGVDVDDAFCDMVKSKFPYLESLTLHIEFCKLKTFDISCASLQRLTIRMLANLEIDIQVDAPKLLLFRYKGETVPSLLFISMDPDQIELKLELYDPIDQLFFLKMREVLKLSSKFNIKILSFGSDFIVPFNIDDLRREVPFPATNVQKLTCQLFSDNFLWEQSPFFDAIFSICHPNYVKAHRGKCSSCTLIVREMMGFKNRKDYRSDLKDVEIQNPLNGEWNTLTSSLISSRDGLICLSWSFAEFKLTWCSP